MGGKNASPTRRIVFHALRIFLGLVFLYAAYGKILNPQAFAQAVYNYRVLPDAAVNLTALILPWLELLVGVCLVTGFWLPGATLMSTGLLTVFIGSLVYNRIRGIDIHCGCFSAGTTTGPADMWTVARDIVFWGISIYLAASVLFLRKKRKKILPSK